MDNDHDKLSRFSRMQKLKKQSNIRNVSSKGNVRATKVSQRNIQKNSGMSSISQHSMLTHSNIENVKPTENNPNYSIASNTSNYKRKADRIPLSPLNPDFILTPSLSQDLNLTIQSKRIRTPNPRYFSPTSCFINPLTDSTQVSSTPRQQTEYQTGSTSASSEVTNSPYSEVYNPTFKSSNAKPARKMKLKNKYIGVQRLDFEDDTEGSFEVVDDIDVFKSTLYATSESEPILNFGLPEVTCKHCFAEVWYEERAEKARFTADVEFSICCQKGDVTIPLLKKPPKLLLDLINGHEPRSRNFKDNIRAYNSMFAFTSMGGQVNDTMNNGGGPPQFILGGQNYHRIGSLLPEAGTTPKFAQLYVFDTQNEVNNRAASFRSTNKKQDPIDLSLVKDLQDMIDSCNPLAKAYRRVRDTFESGVQCKLSLRLYRNREKDSRMHNIPTADEVAGLIVGDFDDSDIGRDVIISERRYGLTRIHETHVLFLPLQYPLLFPRGENGWEPDIPRNETDTKKRERVTIREFIAYRIQERKMEFGNILSSKRLFQQFVVDCYTMLEAQRLSFIRENQSKIRQDVLSGLQEAVDRGDLDASLVGKRVIVPDSFTGGPRYMFNNCQDAMGICKKVGFPDLFITITCNANWPEIRNFLLPKGLQPADRPDIVCRVFKMKLDEIMDDFKKKERFGKVIAGMYTIEFQKRGLPHAHMLLWLDGKHKLNSGRDIDKLISAELPHPELYPKLHAVVASFMMHGPCGEAKRSSPCMKGRSSCSKFFPKKYKSSTSIDEDGYPSYKRRNTGVVVEKNGVKLDNGYVVPYNPFLLMRYQAHINVEACNKSNAIKYLFKYVNKGPDRSNIVISNDKSAAQQPEVIDEIKRFYDCRYISPSEAVWRLLAFDIHRKFPAVIRLSIHLENQQCIKFDDNSSLENVVRYREMVDTMFLAWFTANQEYEQGRDLTYAEFPSKFVYNSTDHRWEPRKIGSSIGRLTYVPVGAGELYYLRVLLTKQRGCTSYESIKTVDGKLCNSFQEACSELLLLKDDQEFKDGLIESYELAS
ncbi:ATP-dependent DNA helicase PIF1, partial [Trifolium medium]|nr:ATP-dependent DNA helicase PIF1 [Trifolium medium]